jgi:hypothetical protein
MIFEDLSFSLCLYLSFFMKLIEIFSMLEDFVQKFLMPCFFPSLLTTSHILFESIKSSRLFLVLSVRFRPLVKFSVNQLASVHQISECLGSLLIKSNLIIHVVLQNFRSKLLLELVNFQAI